MNRSGIDGPLALALVGALVPGCPQHSPPAPMAGAPEYLNRPGFAGDTSIPKRFESERSACQLQRRPGATAGGLRGNPGFHL